MNMKNDFLLWALQGYAHRFPLNKGKRRVVKYVSNMFLDTSGIKTTTLRFNNLKLYCDLSKHMQSELFFFGAYEKAELKLWMNMARGASTIFDVGANVGLYSLLAASTNPNATIHAFEPTPTLSRAIDKNIQANNLQNIVVNRMAVGNVNGSVFLNFCSGADGNNEGMNFVTTTKMQSDDEPTTAVTLDQYCHEHGISSIDLMKMDVEGGEYAVLLGAQELLKRKAIKYIIVELVEWAAHRSGYSTTDVKRILVENGYQIYAVQAGKRVPLAVEGTDYSGNVLAVANT